MASFSVAVLGHSAETRGPGDPLAFASSSKWVVLGVGPLLLGGRRSWAHGGLSGGAVWLTVSAFLCAWSEGSRRVPHVPPRGCTGDPRVVSLVASAPETEARGCLSTGFYATCIMCAPNRSLDPRPPGGDDQGRVQVCGLCHLEHTCEGLGTGGTGIRSPFLTPCLMPGRACGLPSAGGRRLRGAQGRGRAGTGRSGAPASGTCQGSGCRRPPRPAGGGRRALLRVVLQEWAWQRGAGQLPGARGPGPAAAARLSSGGACQRVSPCCRGDRGAAWKRHQPARCGSSAGRRGLTSHRGCAASCTQTG